MSEVKMSAQLAAQMLVLVGIAELTGHCEPNGPFDKFINEIAPWAETVATEMSTFEENEDSEQATVDMCRAAVEFVRASLS